MNNQPTFYSRADKLWTGADGMQVPESRLQPTERKKEKAAKKLYELAVKNSVALEAFKKEAEQVCLDLYEEALAAMGADAKRGKGNFVWYNFDKSFKVEIDMQDRIVYDELKLQAAKQKFDDYIKAHTGNADDLIITLVNDAFTNTKGKVDNKKIQTLVSYKDRFKGAKYALWHEGCDLITSAATVASSKRYIRFSVRTDDGSYQNIDLNWSSI